MASPEVPILGFSADPGGLGERSRFVPTAAPLLGAALALETAPLRGGTALRESLEKLESSTPCGTVTTRNRSSLRAALADCSSPKRSGESHIVSATSRIAVIRAAHREGWHKARWREIIWVHSSNSSSVRRRFVITA